MDAVTSVDDAALPRSRPMLTTLTDQAEMFTLQVPISLHSLTMRTLKPRIHFLPLLLILLWQVTNASCASLEVQTYTSGPFNPGTPPERNFTNPKNLSELIEYFPLNLEKELENFTAVEHRGGIYFVPKVIKMKLKTGLIIENPTINNQTGFHPTYGEIKTRRPNASDPFTEIEYLDNGNDFPKMRLHRSLIRNAFDEKSDDSSISNDESINSSEEDTSTENMVVSKSSEENHVSRSTKRSKYAKSRQLLFHPYLPYGKDIPPDEKISFHDVLPVKMVKFVKSMVEEADWNGMFKSMVRTVVDHFVNKIIEKMFSEKEGDHFKRRSLDVVLTPAFVLPTFNTPLVRLKRSLSTNKNPGQTEDAFYFLLPKRMSQEVDKEGEKKSADERKTWLDHFLDFVFPNSKSDDSYKEATDRLKKRDTTKNGQLFKLLVTFFINTFEKSTEFLTDAKDVLRYKMLKEFLPYLYEKKYTNIRPNSTGDSEDAMKMTHRKLTKVIFNRNDIADSLSSGPVRLKRSTRDNFQEDEDKRLWQSHPRRHGPHSYASRDECSLRKACNAGRLLSRLPSVQDITLQLRSDGNEPHWDALLWGMKKKRCSRIFCKRQRSPKGSKYSWSSDKERLSKKVEIITEPEDGFVDTHNLTIKTLKSDDASKFKKLMKPSQ